MGERLSLTVDRPAFGGGVIAQAPDGRVVFLRGAAPGDRVEVELTEVRRRFARGRITALTPGADRATPFCPHVASCGGCPWMVIPEDAQRAALEAHVRRGLGRFADAPPTWPPIAAPAPHRAWRSTARLHWDAGAVGYRAAGERTVIDVDACPVLRLPLPALYAAIRARLGPHLAGQGTLRITADPAHPSGTVALRCEQPASGALRAAVEALVADEPTCHGAILASDGRVERFGRPVNALDGVEHPAEAFAQAHRDGNRVLTAAVVEAVVAGLDRAGGPRAALELYAGSGNFTFALAAQGVAVTAVEIVEAAVQALRAAADTRGLGDRIRPIVGDAARLPQSVRNDPPAVALLDPPRSGARDAVDALCRLGPGLRRLVYVSCNPATLARDIGRCVERGWRLTGVRAFDLFPHTGHVEVLAVLDRPA